MEIVATYLLIGLFLGVLEVLVVEKRLEKQEKGIKIKEGSLDSYYKLREHMSANAITISVILLSIFLFPVSVSVKVFKLAK